MTNHDLDIIANSDEPHVPLEDRRLAVAIDAAQIKGTPHTHPASLSGTPAVSLPAAELRSSFGTAAGEAPQPVRHRGR